MTFQDSTAAAQSVARILDANASSSSLPALNSAVSAIVQMSSSSHFDRNALADDRCHELVQTVLRKVEELSPDDLVVLCDWYGKSRKLKFGWPDMSSTEKEKLLRRLKPLISSEYSGPQVMTVLTALISSGINARGTSLAIAQRLNDPQAVFSPEDLRYLLKLVYENGSISRHVLPGVLTKLQQVDLSLIDSKLCSGLYRALSLAETKEATAYLHNFNRNFVHQMMQKLPTYSETDLLHFADVHTWLPHRRVNMTAALISEITHRLQRPELLTRQFQIQVTRVLGFLHSAREGRISHELEQQLLLTLSEVIQLQMTSTQDIEQFLRHLMAFTSESPPQLIAAVKKRLSGSTRDALAVPTAVKFLHRVKEDYSCLEKQIAALCQNIKDYNLSERVHLLNGICTPHSHPLEQLETVILESFLTDLQEKPISESGNALHRLSQHYNKALAARSGRLREAVLQQLLKPWEHENSVSWKLYTGLLACRGNESLWKEVIKVHEDSLDEGVLFHAWGVFTFNAEHFEPLLILIETLPKLAMQDILAQMWRFMPSTPSDDLVVRYLRLLNLLQSVSLKRWTCIYLLEGLVRLVKEHGTFGLLPHFLQLLKAAVNEEKEEAHKSSLYAAIALLIETRQIEEQEAKAYVQSLIESQDNDPMCLTAICSGLNWHPDSLLFSQLTHQLNSRLGLWALSGLRDRIDTLSELRAEVSLRGLFKEFRMMTNPMGAHLFGEVLGVTDVLPSRFLSFCPEFVSSLHTALLEMYVPSQCDLSPQESLKFLRQLAVQHSNSKLKYSLVATISAKYGELCAREKVEYLSVLCRFAESFEHYITDICIDMEKHASDYVPYAGRILAALSDSGLQHEPWSAHLAESLIFAQGHKLQLSPESVAQILMYALRIGMEDSSLTRKLLAVPPPVGPGAFSMKRYLLHLHYQGRDTANFSQKEELESFKRAIAASHWKRFHTKKLSPEVSRELGEVAYEQEVFLNNYYVPLHIIKSKTHLWTVPAVARLPESRRLLGDYEFYESLAQKVAGLTVERREPKTRGIA